MPKFYRIDATVTTMIGVEVQNRSDGTVSRALRDAYNHLTGGQRSTLSTAMKQGVYTHKKPGILVQGQARHQANIEHENEETCRKYLRSLIFVFTLKSTKPFDAALADAQATTTQIVRGRNLDGILIGELNARLMHELENTDAQVLSIRQGMNELAWAGWDRLKYRPLLAGSAIGQRNESGPGTLGCFVERNGEVFILSNYHVLKQSMGAGGPGDGEIIQPGHLVGGSYFDVVADYVDGERPLDAAIARVRRGITVNNRTTGPNAFDITGHSANVNNNMAVQKCGCATGYRRGEISDSVAFATPARNRHGIGITTDNIKVVRDDQADARLDVGFQVQGDSGSVICNMAGDVVGLLNVKHPDGSALATLITPILNHFGVTILVGQRVSPGRIGNLINFRTKLLQRNPSGGIKHRFEWDSSTGDRADLGHIRVREHVSWPNPPAAAAPYIIPPEPLEDYTRAGDHWGVGNAASTLGTAEYSEDNHHAFGLFRGTITNWAGPGDLVVTFDQEYEINVANAGWVVIPNTHYTLERRVTPLGNNRVRVTLTKINTTIGADRLDNFAEIP